MRNYELLTVFPGTLTETELEPELEKVKKTIENFGAEDLKVKDLGKTRMAYPIDGVEYGYYYVHQYQLDSSQTQELRKELDKIKSLLRSIMDKYSPEKRERKIEKAESLQGRDEILKMIKKKHSSKDQSEEEDGNSNQEKQKENKEEEESKEEKSKEKEQEDNEKKEEEDVSLDEIDEKLDEILDDEDLTDV